MNFALINLDMEETEKPPIEDEQLLGFEDESYVVAVNSEKIEIPGIGMTATIGTEAESTQMEVVTSTTPVVEIHPHPQPLISYDDLCFPDYTLTPDNGCWQVDLTALGY